MAWRAAHRPAPIFEKRLHLFKRAAWRPIEKSCMPMTAARAGAASCAPWRLLAAERNERNASYDDDKQNGTRESNRPLDAREAAKPAECMKLIRNRPRAHNGEVRRRGCAMMASVACMCQPTF